MIRDAGWALARLARAPCPPASDAGAGDAGEAAHHASEKVTWRDWARFAFDGLSGRYLYQAVTSRGVDTKARASSTRSATRARTRRDKKES